MRYSDLLVENWEIFIPPLHSAPLLGGSPLDIAIPLGMDKLEWCGYPMVENFEDMYNRLNTTPACDGRTDRQTDGHLATA